MTIFRGPTIGRATEIRDVMREVQRLDQEWLGKGASGDTRMTPWMPFSVPQFLTLALMAVPEARGTAFLEIGAGIGTKMLLAQQVLGLSVYGIERNAAYVAQGRSLGLNIAEDDALGWTGYNRFDIIWFNRPFRDRDLQAKLESQVWRDMAPESIVIAANLEAPPPSSWLIIDQDVDHRCLGAWLKP